MVNFAVGQILIQVTCVTTPSTGLHYRTSSPLCACLVSERGMISGRFLLGAWICMQTQLFVFVLFSVKHAWLCALSLEQWLPVFSARNKRNGRGVKQVTNRAAQSEIFNSNYFSLKTGNLFKACSALKFLFSSFSIHDFRAREAVLCSCFATYLQLVVGPWEN